MCLGSCVQFDEKVFAHSPDYDAYRGEIFEVIAFRHKRTHVELKCLSNPAVIVQGFVQPSDLKSVPRKTTKPQQMKGRTARQKTKHVETGNASKQIKPPLKAQTRTKISAKIRGSMSLSKGSIVPQSDRESLPNQVHHVSARTLRAMKRKAQARDHAPSWSDEHVPPESLDPDRAAYVVSFEKEATRAARSEEQASPDSSHRPPWEELRALGGRTRIIANESVWPDERDGRGAPVRLGGISSEQLNVSGRFSRASRR